MPLLTASLYLWRQAHDVTSFELLQNRVKGCRSLVEEFKLSAPGGAKLICEPPCVGVFKCNILTPFVIMAADVGSTKTRWVCLGCRVPDSVAAVGWS